MINIIQIDDLRKLVFNNEPSKKKCCFPLFHGTRKYALTCSDEERKIFYDACHKVLKFSKELIKNHSISEDELKVYQQNKLVDGKKTLFLGVLIYQYGNSCLYEYGDFYVANTLVSAIQYSLSPGGELGKNAYHQCIGIKDFNLSFDEEISNAIDIVVNEYSKFKESERIVLVFKDVFYADLKHENGSNLIPPNDNNLDRYKGKCEDNFNFNKSFRLYNIEKYPAYVVNESMFKESLRHLTDIKDIEKYVKNNHRLEVKI